MTRLTDITDIIRSKNAGPYELTFDLMFKTDAWYQKVADADVINAALIAALYKIPQSDVLKIVHFAPAKAIKITIRRRVSSGSLGETDVYGAQQHAPLLGLEFDL
ncbi:MAG: DUF4387 domain-containing protein [Oscillospiraceae bacterium]|nr:DUF4387 domain-containing protein [Oscillospiraceae bacterium]